MAWTAEHAYDDFPRVEEEFGAALDVSLDPRGPDQLYEILAGLGAAPGATVLDVGCGEGRHSARLHALGYAVTGVDPVPRQLEIAAAAAPGVTFLAGTAEALPVPDASVDVVWCRDVMVHVPEPAAAYAQFHRVLRPGGHALVYQMLFTDLLEPGERRLFVDAMGIAETADRAHADAAIAASGLRVVRGFDIGSEWGEHDQEHTGKPARNLLRAARLRRRADEYLARYGRRTYDMMLADCLWHVYAMLGKLTRRAVVLARPPA